MSLLFRAPHSASSLAALTLTTLAVASVACSSKAGTSTPARGTVASADVSAYTAAVCDRIQRCDPGFIQSELGDVTACNAKLANDSDDILNGPGTAVTKAQLDACIAKLQQAGCETPQENLAECKFVGTLADGAACSADSDCKSASCFKVSVEDLTAPCGVCSARAPVGGDCSAANCEPGVSCSNGKCVTRLDLNAACSDATPCKIDLQCAGGKCAKPLPKDAECDLSSQDAVTCDLGASLYCAAVSAGASKGKCTTIAFAKAGLPCSNDPIAGTLCSAASCVDGKCVPDLKEGDACTDNAEPVCEYALDCKGGKCVKQAQACN
jgi:hypothetical protein